MQFNHVMLCIVSTIYIYLLFVDFSITQLIEGVVYIFRWFWSQEASSTSFQYYSQEAQTSEHPTNG